MRHWPFFWKKVLMKPPSVISRGGWVLPGEPSIIIILPRRPSYAIIERFGREVICEAEKAAAEKGGGILERMFALFGCMNIRRLTRDEQILDYLHRPQNALFHEKSNTMLIAALRPLLGELLREGREEGMFTNPYEEETAELILLSIIGFLDYTAMEAGKKALERRVESLLYNVERMLGAREGTLSHLKKLG